MNYGVHKEYTYSSEWTSKVQTSISTYRKWSIVRAGLANDEAESH